MLSYEARRVLKLSVVVLFLQIGDSMKPMLHRLCSSFIDYLVENGFYAVLHVCKIYSDDPMVLLYVCVCICVKKCGAVKPVIFTSHNCNKVRMAFGPTSLHFALPKSLLTWGDGWYIFTVCGYLR